MAERVKPKTDYIAAITKAKADSLSDYFSESQPPLSPSFSAELTSMDSATFAEKLVEARNKRGGISFDNRLHAILDLWLSHSFHSVDTLTDALLAIPKEATYPDWQPNKEDHNAHLLFFLNEPRALFDRLAKEPKLLEESADNNVVAASRLIEALGLHFIKERAKVADKPDFRTGHALAEFLPLTTNPNLSEKARIRLARMLVRFDGPHPHKLPDETYQLAAQNEYLPPA